MRRLLIGFAALFLIAAAPSPGDSEARQVLANYEAAWVRTDGVALARLYSNDAELVSLAATANGRTEIEQLYTSAFAAGMAGTRLTTELKRTTRIVPGVTYAHGSWAINPGPGSAASAFCGRFFAVLRRNGGTWRIASFSEVPVACGVRSM